MSETDERKETANQLARRIMGAAIEVHRHLGPGLLESAYEACLCRELALQHIAFRRQVPVPILYKGIDIDCAYRLDILAGEMVIIEVKAVEALEPIHDAQLLTYLRLTGHWLGLLINFNVPGVKDGFKRLVLG